MNTQQIKVNEFVKWTATDEQGQFSHVGKLINLTDSHRTIQFPFGVALIPSNDGALELHAPILLQVENINDEPVVAKIKKSRTVTKKSTEGVSKFDRCVQICKDHPNATRKELIQLFVSLVGMTEKGANTYSSTAKKAAQANN